MGIPLKACSRGQILKKALFAGSTEFVTSNVWCNFIPPRSHFSSEPALKSQTVRDAQISGWIVLEPIESREVSPRA